MDSSPLWGIDGPAFLVAFVPTGLLLAVFALAVRERAVSRLPETDELYGYVLACLSPRKNWKDDVVVASLVRLRSQGLVEVAHGRVVRSAGGGAAPADPLDRAVLRAVGESAGIGGLESHPAVVSELLRLQKEYRGWEAGARRAAQAAVRKARPAVLPLGALLGVGAVRFFAEVANGEPVGFLLLFLAVLLLLGAAVPVLLRRWVPTGPPRDWSGELRERREAMVGRRLREVRARPLPDGADQSVDEIVLSTAYFGPAGLKGGDQELAELVTDEARREDQDDEALEAWHRTFGLGGGSLFGGSGGKRFFSGGSSYGGAYRGPSRRADDDDDDGYGGCGGCGCGE